MIDVMPDKGAGTWAVYANGKSIGMTNTREVVESLIEEALTAPPEA